MPRPSWPRSRRTRDVEVRLQGWEEFEGKVDRIVCIGAFEHFGHERYDAVLRHGLQRAARRRIDAAAHDLR